jgi:hypothetical protein
MDEIRWYVALDHVAIDDGRVTRLQGLRHSVLALDRCQIDDVDRLDIETILL